MKKQSSESINFPPKKAEYKFSHSSPTSRGGDRFFRNVVLGFGLVVILLALGFAWELIWQSRLAWKEFGLGLIFGMNWDPVLDIYGALPFIYGTLVSSALALLIAIPLGLGSAIFLAEMAPRHISNWLSFLIELLAAVPSVVLGLMGIFLLVPFMASIQPFLIRYLGWIPLFSGSPYGVGLLTAGMILSIMILPYITSISRDIILTVPRSQKEGAFALGATHWEVITNVILPYARSGILGAIFLALGRALGETMAVTMVIGNTPQITPSLFDPAYSMAAVIANQFTEATTQLELHSLIGIGLILFGITFIVNAAARLLIYKLTIKGGRI